MRALLTALLLAGNAWTQVSLHLDTPEVLGCGRAEVGGGFTAAGLQETPPTWEWGDGSTTRSFFPAAHRYAQDGNYSIKVSILQGTTILISRTVAVTISGSLSPSCANVVLPEPSRLYLRDGVTSASLKVTRIAPDGTRTMADSKDLTFRSLSPALVNVTAAGIVSSKGFGDGTVEVEEKLTGVRLRVPVFVGDLRLEPPYLRLHLSANPQAQLQIAGSNADGTPLSLTGRKIRFFSPNQPNSQVISLSATGLVRALKVPPTLAEVPLVGAELDGVLTNNLTIARVADSYPEIIFTDLADGMVRFTTAQRIGRWNYEEILKQADAAKWTNLANDLESEVTGYRTHRGGIRVLVSDIGSTSDPADATVPCGLNGNPTRLGASPVNDRNSCVIAATLDNPVPSWFVYFHELGHDYSFVSTAFNKWYQATPNPFSTTITEGMASVFSQYVAEVFRQRGDYQLPASIATGLDHTQSFADSPRWTRALDNYVSSGSRFSQLNADVFNGITGSLLREFGTGWLVRLYSTLPPDAHDFQIEGEMQASTFLIAAASAAAESDLRSRFNNWGFPLDNSYYAKIYPTLFQYSRARTPLISPGGIVNAAGFNGGGVAPAEWISLFGSHLAPRFAVGPSPVEAREGTAVEFVDGRNISRKGVVQFVSGDHVNVLAPEGMAAGSGQIRATSYSGTTTVPVTIKPIHAGLFSAGSSGKGPASATWLLVRGDGQRESGLTFNASLQNIPLDLSAGDFYISFYGTGFRGSQTVAAKLGGETLPVLGAVAQGQYAGLDQLVVGPLPRTLIGRGEVTLEASFDGVQANQLTIAVN